MHDFFIEKARLEGRTVHFAWRVEPKSALYKRTSFFLRFPEEAALESVPPRLWVDIALMCLHAHWLVLRPCRVHLPVKLADGEIAFWLALLRNGADSLQAYRVSATAAEPLAIEFVNGEESLLQQRIGEGGHAAAFSGGKDSLLQAGLLLELADRPLLVATTSPMPPLSDHVTKRRRQVFDSIVARTKADFVEVESDLRASWHNGFAAGDYGVAINELTDTFLYTSSLVAAAALEGRTNLFLASEAEVQESSERFGAVVQHPHFMYSAATQRALSHYLSGFGFHLSSLLWPLYSMQVQHLLWQRYPQISDLQYSCWRVGENEATCSQCEQCLRIATNALSAGHDPGRIGIDLMKVMSAAEIWPPAVDERNWPQSPRVRSIRRMQALTAGNIRSIDANTFKEALLRSAPHASAVEFEAAFASFADLSARASEFPQAPDIGVREGFLDWLHEDFREAVSAIYRDAFGTEPAGRHEALLQNSASLTDRAVAALKGE